MLTPLLLAAVVGYLLGSLPFGYLVARAHGVNIFEVGSKNPGATNVRRVLGSRAGNMVFALDAVKGALATAAPWAYWYLSREATPGSTLGPLSLTNLEAAGLVGAFLGHSFSCFTRFRGGKGVATGAGGFAVLFPLGVLIALVVWLLSLAICRYVSVSSMLAAIALPVAAFFLGQPGIILGASVLIAVLVVVWHRTNLARLAAGTESKVGQKPAAPKS
ncbi:glycerol-3-phosphate 1-O-acyltransferase PlsY [Opitutus sp. ER46]|uniref:glycerol-3-phosphate 1-O-acyltransferase PlsY n=1 Tax=Opitutus sp. ER46 TaxID=2161864 RepID=UPI000D2F51DA|nr:glycerol-3-phosphate 1-O-acyltransferase PlsY [Opitutus sp. ER46]PTX90764.1 acyl-phosphate glycerol 3-phosphate acyltransferase [Opitutus sp. ER46]